MRGSELVIHYYHGLHRTDFRQTRLSYNASKWLALFLHFDHSCQLAASWRTFDPSCLFFFGIKFLIMRTAFRMQSSWVQFVFRLNGNCWELNVWGSQGMNYLYHSFFQLCSEITLKLSSWLISSHPPPACHPIHTLVLFSLLSHPGHWPLNDFHQILPTL